MRFPANFQSLVIAATAASVIAAAAAVTSVDAFSTPSFGSSSTETEAARTPTSLASAVVPALPLSAPPTYALFGLAAKKAEQSQPRMFEIPAIFGPSDDRPIILFDGKCNLCNAGVQLILDTDRASSDPRGNLRIAALQSRVGKLLLARLPEEQRANVFKKPSGSDGGKEYRSIVVVSPTRTWFNSAACLRIGRELRGPLRYIALLAYLIPPFVRDPLYLLLSRYRKRIFGEAPECRLWDDNWDTRFVDDSLFGGKGSTDVDPFADPNAASGSDEDDDDDDNDIEEAPPGSPTLASGDSVRIVSSKPILHTHVPGFEKSALCSTGLVGTVSRILSRRAYPKNIAVEFELEGENGISSKFEAHFFPGQVKKEGP